MEALAVFFSMLHNLWPCCVKISFVTLPRGGIRFLWLCSRFPQLGLSHTCLPSPLSSVGGGPCPARRARPVGYCARAPSGAVLLMWGCLDQPRWEPGAGGSGLGSHSTFAHPPAGPRTLRAQSDWREKGAVQRWL